MTGEARLSGALLAMAIAAALLAVVGLCGLAFAFDQLRATGTRYTIAVLFLTAWSLVFLVMTVMRARATPVVASGGLLLWVAYRLCVAAIAGGWPLVLDLLAEAILAAGFCGYMATGLRPNAYYRRRLPAA
jgi:hypothetical protein